MATTLYACVLRIAIGLTTLIELLALRGDNSPRLTVTTRLFSELELPVTEPLSEPVIVGRPPLEMSWGLGG